MLKLLKRIRVKFIVKRINKALNITLYDWQIDYIFEDLPYSFDIFRERGNGKTTARILALCLSRGNPICLSSHDYFPLYKLQDGFDPPEWLRYVGADSESLIRFKFFIRETREVYRTLSTVKGLKLRKITFRGI